ncbi:MFS transporter [Streptomyces sp. TS71-3]|uniref:MFS transporter n=1 Tax=Streptomyces sp. TS71-3 TaxID=2733862 RepID=UPI001B0A9D84|nr:MFS transporter [Streptomyces sp. TS71-3]GHJ41632.1 MFS transporter [Streptomyces sp. TS71-3]
MARRRDYRLFLTAQTISNLGSSFTSFGLPLLVFRLTGSPLKLALTTVSGFLPYLLFGLVIGAWIDRVDRRRVMIGTVVARGLTIAVLPVLAASGTLVVWDVYAVAFVNTSLGIASSAIEGTAVPGLVSGRGLARANGALRGGYAAAKVVGPLLAGALIGGGVPVTGVFVVDAVSFWIAAAMLRAVRTPFNAPRAPARTSVAADIATGLRHVRADPALCVIALHAALYNLIGSTVTAQLVLFAHERLGAGDARVGVLYAGGAAGTAVALLTSSRIADRVPFPVATLGVMTCWSILVLGMSASTHFVLGALLWTCAAGLPTVYAVQTLTYRQTAVPEHLLGRVQTTGQVLAWSAQPVGATVGATVIHATGDIAAVYAASALLMLVITLFFWLGPFGRSLSAVRTTTPPMPQRNRRER